MCSEVKPHSGEAGAKASLNRANLVARGRREAG